MNAIRQVARRTSYKTKLMLYYLASVSFPILLGLVYMYNTMVTQADQSFLNTIRQRMEQERSGIQQTVADIQSSAYLLSTQTDINRFFTLRYYNPVELVEAMNQRIMPTLSWFEAIAKSVERFRFLTQNPFVPENEFMEQSSRYAQEPWFQQAMEMSKRQGYYREPLHPARNYLYVSHNETHVYSWFYPLLSSNAGNTTLLEVSMDARRLFKDINHMPIAESGFLFTVSGQTLIQTGGFPEELTAWVRGEENQKMLRNPDGSGKIIRLGRKLYYYSGLYIADLDTTLGCIVPTEEIAAPARAVRNTFAAVSLGIIAVILALSYLVAKLLLRRIQRMLTAVKTIQRGNFDVRIPLHGQDEIDELAGEINIMARKIDELINTVYLAESLQKESQLAALQAQINPHFLFNTLETLRMSVELGETDKIKTGLLSLSGLMRYTLSAAKMPVPLATELRNLSYYMNIQRMLLDDRVRFIVEIPEPVRESVQIMALTLQPILENSIQHGFRKRIGILEITLTAQQVENGTILHAADNGTGISQEDLRHLHEELAKPNPPQKPQARGGIGLWNVNRRLVLPFGEASALKMRKNLTGGVVTDIFLPGAPTSWIGGERSCTGY